MTPLFLWVAGRSASYTILQERQEGIVNKEEAMGRKRTQLTTKEEIGFVRSYIEKKFGAKNWPSRETQHEALTDFKQRPTSGRYAHDELIRWCNQWLSDTQWRQFKFTLNSWRHRQRTKELPKRVQLSPNAWKIISTLAEADNKTISSYIVGRLEAEYSMLINDKK